MLFNSLHFILFFPIVLLLHFSLKLRARTAFLFLASYYFYMAWMPSYALLIFSSTIVDFFLAKSISRSKNTAFRKALLIFSLSFNLGFLFFFKYLNFAISQVNVFFEFFGVFSNFRSLDLILPVGISFYTLRQLKSNNEIFLL